MNLLHRITATVTGSVDRLVSHVENHEAVVEAALNDTRAASAKARVRLQRVHKDGEAMRIRLAELRRNEMAWSERAVAAGQAEEAKALECLKRRNLSRAQAAQTEAMLARHETVEREVAASVERIEARLSELTEQRNLMRSRHSAADALRVIGRIEGGSAHGIEDIFDRWEMRITETEYETGAATQADSFEAGFRQEESDASLRADLAALLGETTTGEKE